MGPHFLFLLRVQLHRMPLIVRDSLFIPLKPESVATRGKTVRDPQRESDDCTVHTSPSRRLPTGHFMALSPSFTLNTKLRGETKGNNTFVSPAVCPLSVSVETESEFDLFLPDPFALPLCSTRADIFVLFRSCRRGRSGMSCSG